MVNKCIQMEEVKKELQQNKKTQIIDVRSKEEFKKYHIPEAVNIALSEIENHINEIKKDHHVIITCEKGGGRSIDGAKILNQMGYNTHWLCGGTNEWINLK